MRHCSTSSYSSSSSLLLAAYTSRKAQSSCCCYTELHQSSNPTGHSTRHYSDRTVAAQLC